MESEEIKKVIREEYGRIAKDVLEKIEVASPNKEFVKIGMKIPKPTDVILGISKTISIGERDWIIDSILRSKNIKEIPMGKEKNLTYSILTNLDYSGGTILIPARLYLKLIDKYSPIRFQAPWNQFEGHNIIPVSDNKLSKIILINNLGVLWEGVKDKRSNSYVIINEEDNKWEIYTLNHLQIFPENIRILNPDLGS